MHSVSKVRSVSHTARFLASSTISVLGNSVSGVVMPLVLLATTGDALAAGALALICAVPQFVAGIVGGGLLDCFNRRDLSVLSDVLSALSMGLLPVVDMTVGLSFGWFVALGILGAVGDVPGMTARDTLVTSVVRRDNGDLRRCIGIKEALENLAGVIGPALASLALTLLGGVGALWITAGLSFAAAVITLTLPREIGSCLATSAGAEGEPVCASERRRGPFRRGLRGLFCGQALLRASVVLGLVVTMVVGGLQGIVLPAYFTQLAQPDRLGYVLSALSLGMLVGSAAYARWVHHLSGRAWLVASFLCLALSLGVLCLLPAYPLMIAAAAVMGLAAGPITALLNYVAYALVPEAARGASMGVLNALYLVASPLSIMACAALVAAFGPRPTALAVGLAFLVPLAYALGAPAMRRFSHDLDRDVSGAQAGSPAAAGDGPRSA